MFHLSKKKSLIFGCSTRPKKNFRGLFHGMLERFLFFWRRPIITSSTLFTGLPDFYSKVARSRGSRLPRRGRGRRKGFCLEDVRSAGRHLCFLLGRDHNSGDFQRHRHHASARTFAPLRAGATVLYQGQGPIRLGLLEVCGFGKRTSSGRNKDASIGFFFGDGTDDCRDGNDLRSPESL